MIGCKASCAGSAILLTVGLALTPYEVYGTGAETVGALNAAFVEQEVQKKADLGLEDVLVPTSVLPVAPGEAEEWGARQECTGDRDIDGLGMTNWGYTLNVYYKSRRSTTIYRASEFNCPGGGPISGIRYYVSQVPAMAMPNLTIRLRHTTANVYTSPYCFNNDGWTTCYQATTQISAAGWYTFVFDPPFLYNGVENLEVDVSFGQNSTWNNSGQIWSFSAGTGNNRTIYAYSDTIANPLNWTCGTGNPTVNGSIQVPRAQFIFPPPVTGACCVNFVCLATTNEPDCIGMGGTWYGGQTCPEFFCPPWNDDCQAVAPQSPPRSPGWRLKKHAHVRHDTTVWATLLGEKVSKIYEGRNIPPCHWIKISGPWWSTDAACKQTFRNYRGGDRSTETSLAVVRGAPGSYTMPVLEEALAGPPFNGTSSLYPDMVSSFFDIFVAIDVDDFVAGGGIVPPPGTVLQVVNGQVVNYPMPGVLVATQPFEFTTEYGWTSSALLTGPVEAIGEMELGLSAAIEYTFYGDNRGATNDCTLFPGGQVWHAIDLPFGYASFFDLYLDYCGTSPPFGNAWLNWAIGCPCTAVTAAGTWDTTTCPDGNLTIRWYGLPPGTYFYPVLLDPNNNAAGPYTLHVVARPAYCESRATSTIDSTVDRVQFGTIDNDTTGVCDTYDDFTALSTDVVQGATYPLAVTLGDCSPPTCYARVGRVFIDWNHDYDFDDPGELVLSQAVPNTPCVVTISTNVVVPPAAAVGPTRMRVICREATDPNVVTPCGTYSYGGTEDYTVTILAAPPGGACCFGATCAPDYLEADCLAQGGVFKGNGWPCDPNPCVGRCCYPDGTCVVQPPAECTGVYYGDMTDCGPPNPCPQPGDDCTNPIVVVLPQALPYTDLDTTCGRGNAYANTCLGYYDGGEDIIYELVVTEDVLVRVVMTTTATWTGMAIHDTCPLDPNVCLYKGTNTGAGGVTLENVQLYASVGVYYLMIDTWPSPNCIPEFTLAIARYPRGACCVGPACSEVTEAQCLAQGGTWLGAGGDCFPNPCVPPPDYYWDITTGEQGGNGYNGEWIYYPNAPGGEWWNMWWPNERAMNRQKQITVTFDVGFPTGGGQLEVALNWATPDWPLVERPPLADEEQYIERGYLELIRAPGTYTYSLTLPYCPAWVSMDVRGVGYRLQGTIQHICLPAPPTGACCVGPACSEVTEAQCLAQGGTWLGAGSDCFPNPCIPIDFWYNLVTGEQGGNGYEGMWYVYPSGWINMWWPNEFDLIRHKRVVLRFWVDFVPDSPGPAVIAFNYSVPSWTESFPPLPPLDMQIVRVALEPPITEPGYYERATVIPFCPRWVSVDIMGWGYWIQGTIEHICLPPVGGACCLPSGQCQQMPPDQCASMGGHYYGDGTLCAPLDRCPPTCAGDTNCDGMITFADIDGFVEALGGEAAWTHWPCPWLNADCTGDGDVTFADIDPFVGLIGTTCP